MYTYLYNEDDPVLPYWTRISINRGLKSLKKKVWCPNMTNIYFFLNNTLSLIQNSFVLHQLCVIYTSQKINNHILTRIAVKWYAATDLVHIPCRCVIVFYSVSTLVVLLLLLLLFSTLFAFYLVCFHEVYESAIDERAYTRRHIRQLRALGRKWYGCHL